MPQQESLYLWLALLVSCIGGLTVTYITIGEIFGWPTWIHLIFGAIYIILILVVLRKTIRAVREMRDVSTEE